MIKKYENHIARKVIGLLLVLVAVVFIFLFPARTYAEAQQVYDNASMLSENEISVLSEAVGRLEDKTGWDLVLLTVDKNCQVIWGIPLTNTYPMIPIRSSIAIPAHR